MRQLNIVHATRYDFSRPLTGIIQLLRLTPGSCISQNVIDWRIDIDCDARLRESRDGYGNIVHMLYVDQPIMQLVITASGRVITEDRNGIVQGIAGDLPPEVFLRTTALTEPDDELSELAEVMRGHSETPLARLHFLNEHLHRQLTFDPDSTSTTTPAATAFATRRGVCQDFAHVFLAVARLAGVPSRYVSGHLFRRDGSASQSAGHAWAEAHVPDLGWVAFDPTNGICADDAYVRIASGLDYREAAPNVGVRRGGGDEGMSVDVQVTQIPRRHRAKPQGKPGKHT